MAKNSISCIILAESEKPMFNKSRSYFPFSAAVLTENIVIPWLDA